MWAPPSFDRGGVAAPHSTGRTCPVLCEAPPSFDRGGVAPSVVVQCRKKIL